MAAPAAPGMAKLLFFKNQLQLQLLNCNSITFQKCNFQLLKKNCNLITFQKKVAITNYFYSKSQNLANSIYYVTISEKMATLIQVSLFKSDVFKLIQEN